MKLKIGTLPLAIALASAGYTHAMDSLTDDTLGEVTGQDGLQVNLSAPSGISATKFGWVDGDYTTGVVPVNANALELYVDNPKISVLTSTINLDFGSNKSTFDGVPALSIDTTTQAFQFSTTAQRIGNNVAGTRNFGIYAIDFPNPTTLTFFSTNGLFDGTAPYSPPPANGNKLSFNMDRANWFLAQPRCYYSGGCTWTGATPGIGTSSTMLSDGYLDGSSTNTQNGDYNILVFRNFTLKGTATGRFTIDAAKGFNFLGTVSLPRVSPTQGGFQVDIATLNNVDFSSSAPYNTFNFGAVSTALAAANNQGRHWRFGFSGDLLNVDISLIGDNGSSVLSEATPGATGLKLTPRFDFGKSTDANEFVLEMGEPVGGAGCNPSTTDCGSSVRFSNWLALDSSTDATGNNRATYNLGSLYLNLLPQGAGNGMQNWVTPASATGYSSFACTAGAACTSDKTNFGAISMYNGASTGENAVALAIRGMELQGGAQTIGFYVTDTGAQLGTSQSWALMPTFYNLNANLLLYPSGHPSYNAPAVARHGTGFDLTIETTGKNTAFGTPSTKGTHLIVADTAAKKYVGFRNIDAQYSFLNSQLYVADNTMDFASGSGLDVAGLRFTSKMSFDIRAGLAVGSLPDGTVAGRMRDDDDVAGFRWKFGGDFSFTFSPPPSGKSYIGLTSTLNATDATKNGMYIVEPVDGTRIEWINITGKLNMVSQNVIDGDYSDASRIDIGYESAATAPASTPRPYFTLATAYELAPGTTQSDADVIRIKSLNLYKTPTVANNVFTGAGGTYKENVDWKPGFALAGTNPAASNPDGTTYRLGEMVITGGKFYGQIDLKPQP